MTQKNGTDTYTGGKTNETLKEILGQLEDISNLIVYLFQTLRTSGCETYLKETFFLPYI